jgi:hypothetical protein
VRRYRLGDVYGDDLPAERGLRTISRPLTAYGWSPLEGMFDGRFKLIVAPRPELYDLAADPGETRNLLNVPEGPARAGRRRAG